MPSSNTSAHCIDCASSDGSGIREKFAQHEPRLHTMAEVHSLVAGDADVRGVGNQYLNGCSALRRWT